MMHSTKNQQNAHVSLLLKKTARSFYLTLNALPKNIRQILSLAYLLARCTDTVADELDLSAEQKLLLLSEMQTSFHDGNKINLLQKIPYSALAPARPEYALLAYFDELVTLLFQLDAKAYHETINVLAAILKGQQMDITLFNVTTTIHCLKTPEELDNYTYYVAGSVGHFWTNICLSHLPHYSKLSPAKLSMLGIAFGKGLQLVNILRDLPKDLARGRCYLPLSQLQTHHLSIHEIVNNPRVMQPLVLPWIDIAFKNLDEGLEYVFSLKYKRLQSILILPIWLAILTLKKLRTTNYLTTEKSIKVSRIQVKCLMIAAFFGIFSETFLKFITARIKAM